MCCSVYCGLGPWTSLDKIAANLGVTIEDSTSDILLLSESNSCNSVQQFVTVSLPSYIASRVFSSVS
jgi:hypothetical protein